MTPGTAVALAGAVGALLVEEWPLVEPDPDARLAAATLAELATALLARDPTATGSSLVSLRRLAVDGARDGSVGRLDVA